MNRDATKGVILIKHAKHGSTYFVTSRITKQPNGSPDRYLGGAGEMNTVSTTDAASVETGVYEDPVDGVPRFYGVPGQEFGPLNVKYQRGATDESLVTNVVKRGAERRAENRFFGMALQVDEPLTIIQLGQFDPGYSHGTYTLSLVRAEDNAVLATADLDMNRAQIDANGFKYVPLPHPLRLESNAGPVVIYPRGLLPAEIYEVRGSVSSIHLRQTGSRLMSEGITLEKTAAGELIFLNLSDFPGSGTDHVPPTPPSKVEKRLGTNLGVQGIELSWLPGTDDRWVSFYEVLKNGKLIGRSAIGTFFFDHSDSARYDIDAVFEVRTVDGDGNRSQAVTAQKAGSQARIYEALGDFSPTQSLKQWEYEEAIEDGSYRELTWDNGGYEGRWTGSGLGRIGRIWMQPSAQYDLSRTFLVPADGVASTSGTIRKDPSAENQDPCFVRIELNSKRVWPADVWAEVRPIYDVPTLYNVTGLHVSKGDKIRFVLKHNGKNLADPIEWNPSVMIQGPDGN